VVRSLAAVLGIDEPSLRESIGLPPDVPVEEPDRMRGELLTLFAEEAIAGEGVDEPGAVEIPVEGVTEPATAGASPTSGRPVPDAPTGGGPIAESGVTTESASELDDGFGSGGVEADQDENEVEVGLPSGRGDQGRAPQPMEPAAAAMTTRTRTIQVGEAPGPPVERSYLDDPDQMMTYWVRAALTVALAVFLLIVLFWALGNLGDSIGEVWDLFKAGA
jgi:hypothetical protein